MPSVYRAPSGRADATAEHDVNAYLDAFVAAEGRRRDFLLRDPLALARAMHRVGDLARIGVAPSSTGDGQLFRRILTAMRNRRLHTPLHAVSAVLEIPAVAGEYETGASKQTLRRKARAAQRRGITWELVTDRAERRALMAIADEHERTSARYGNSDSEHGELVEHGVWMVARAGDGAPLLLSVTPIDGVVAALRYFRVLRAGDDASAARYLMTQVLVEQLRRRGVQHLLDTTPSMRLPHGLRHFQRMVGFRLVRVDLVAEHRTVPALPASALSLPRQQRTLASSFWDRVLSDVVLLRTALLTCVAAVGAGLMPSVPPF